MDVVSWVWIPIVLAAALAQTLRNAAQRELTQAVGTLAATFARLIYGLPFAFAWLLAVVLWYREPLPATNYGFLGWIVVGALSNVAGTALLLSAMTRRNFLVAVAYGKTEILMVALFSLLLIGEVVSGVTAAAMVLATLSVLILSVQGGARGLRSLADAAMSGTGWMGIGSGAAFAVAIVSYRAAALELGPAPPFVLVGAFGMTCAQLMQSALLGAYLLARRRSVLGQALKSGWLSHTAGMMGALATIGWLTAVAIRPASDVRTLALVEVLFSYAISRRLFKERLQGFELAGIVLLVISLGVLSSQL